MCPFLGPPGPAGLNRPEGFKPNTPPVLQLGNWTKLSFGRAFYSTTVYSTSSFILLTDILRSPERGETSNTCCHITCHTARSPDQRSCLSSTSAAVHRVRISTPKLGLPGRLATHPACVALYEWLSHGIAFDHSTARRSMPPCFWQRKGAFVVS